MDFIKKDDRAGNNDNNDKPAGIYPRVYPRVYWMDPEDWGKYAWTILFCIVPDANASDRALEMWRHLMMELPKILPCITCRKCCESYVRWKPPPGINSTFTDRCHWLLILRHRIRQRNIEKGNITKELAFRKGHYSYLQEHDSNFTVYQYRAVLRVRPLLLLNAFVFLICSAATLDPAREKAVSLFFSHCFHILNIYYYVQEDYKEEKENKENNKSQRQNRKEQKKNNIDVFLVQRASINALIQQFSVKFEEFNKPMLTQLFNIALPVHYS